MTRLTAKIQISRSLDPCWEWTAHCGQGYGRIGVDGASRLAYRVMYELLVGPVPDGLELDHTCLNRRCVNPEHLEPVTHLVNSRRSSAGKVNAARNRAKTHCVHGHEFTPENTHINGKGHRSCWECRRISGEAYNIRRRRTRQ